MGLEIEHRPSTSRYIARVWRSTGERAVEEMLAVAYARWDLVFMREWGQVRVWVVGPEPRARRVPVPDGEGAWGINFEFGVVLPHLPASREVFGNVELPDATRRSFRLAGSRWDLPTFENAEAFVAALVREEIVLRDGLVTDVHRGTSTDLSARTVQRRFVSATGLTRGAARQIDRARNAAALIQEGFSPADVVEHLGFYDHAHVARALTRYIGRTATELRRPDQPLPLSLLYKT